MAITRVGTTKYTPVAGATGSATTRTLGLNTLVNSSGGSVTLQANDTIFVQVVTASGAAANEPALSGITGLTKIDDRVFSGHRQVLYLKDLAVSGDATATLTVATAAALRVTIQIAVYRGAATPVINVVSGVNGPASSTTNITTATGTTSATAVAELQFIAGAGTVGVTSFTKPAAMTAIATESYDPGTAGGNSYAVIAENLTNLTNGSVIGGDLWTANTAALLSAITVGLKASSGAASVRPTTALLTTGYTSTAGSDFVSPLTDESDASYITGPSNPDGSQSFRAAVDVLSGGPVTWKFRHMADAASPTLVRTYTLLQGSTVIGTRTVTLPTTVTDYLFTTTTAETNAITDYSQLRFEFKDVSQ